MDLLHETAKYVVIIGAFAAASLLAMSCVYRPKPRGMNHWNKLLVLSSRNGEKHEKTVY